MVSKGQMRLEDQVDMAWREYSLDAPRLPSPIPSYTQGLRRICIVIHLTLPLAKIIFGARYVLSCPTNNWLPTYLLVGGLLQFGFFFILIYPPLRRPVLLGAMGVSILVWMLIASINIFVEWKPDFFLGGARYCSRALFDFALFVSVTEYVIITVLMLYVCTQFAYYKVDGSTSHIV